jgi:hypothetical protein
VLAFADYRFAHPHVQVFLYAVLFLPESLFCFLEIIRYTALCDNETLIDRIAILLLLDKAQNGTSKFLTPTLYVKKEV